MGTILDGWCTIRLLKGTVKGKSKDLDSRLVGNFVPNTHNL